MRVGSERERLWRCTSSFRWLSWKLWSMHNLACSCFLGVSELSNSEEARNTDDRLRYGSGPHQCHQSLLQRVISLPYHLAWQTPLRNRNMNSFMFHLEKAFVCLDQLEECELSVKYLVRDRLPSSLLILWAREQSLMGCHQ